MKILTPFYVSLQMTPIVSDAITPFQINEEEEEDDDNDKDHETDD